MTQLRCAIYTRKSSDEGLDQEFNSLDAQREACEAYILSQKSEGWRALTARYDDGGWSGGSMERPALARLLADITTGLVDVVVVYKVDRLTRSLHDFARMVEVFDKRNVSFVSVTQAFNTTSSMGRLTLNVLLSFAQFEREVTGERIRDKIAASKAKGMWMGGYPPLGYDPDGRTLVVNETEATLVRHIFARYLELGSVHRLMEALAHEGVRSKRWISRAGKVRGDVAYSRGALFHLLRNRLYLGEIVHKGVCHPGQHEGVVDPAIFEAVEDLLAANGVNRRARIETRAPLTGLIHDAAGNRMSPAHAQGKSGRRYLYYVSAPLQTGGKLDSGVIGRMAASTIEPVVLDRLRVWSGQHNAGWPELGPHLKRLEIHKGALVMDIVPGAPEVWLANIDGSSTAIQSPDGGIRISTAITLPTRGGPAWRIDVKGAAPRLRPDRALIAGLRRAHSELRRCGIDLLDPQAAFEDACGVGDPYIRKLTRLAFLAPDIQCAILEGRQPAGLVLGRLMERPIPLDWKAQRAVFGF